MKGLGNPQGELSILFTGGSEMKELNRKFRRIPKATDVLSFPSGDGPEEDLLGDIAVCVPVARRQAKKAGWSIEREVLYLLVHGILHLLGHDHERSKAEEEKMERMQKILMDIGYPKNAGARKAKARI
ncbi:MAG: rRNA maturation RNase YbeY [Nitrospinota bacterium]